MKFFAFFAFILAMSGCEKDRSCWTCQTTHLTTYADGSPADTTRFASERCDQSPEEIDRYQEEGSYTTTVTSNGRTYTVSIAVSCSR